MQFRTIAGGTITFVVSISTILAWIGRRNEALMASQSRRSRVAQCIGAERARIGCWHEILMPRHRRRDKNVRAVIPGRVGRRNQLLLRLRGTLRKAGEAKEEHGKRSHSINIGSRRSSSMRWINPPWRACRARLSLLSRHHAAPAHKACARGPCRREGRRRRPAAGSRDHSSARE